MGHVEHVGDVGLLGTFLGELHDLLAAFLARHAAGVNVAELAIRATNPACLNDTSLGLDATHSCAINSKKDGDVSVADISGSIGIWLNKAQDQVIALFSCQFDCGSLEVVLTIGLPARCALRITKSKPNVTIMRFTHTGDQVVMGLDCVTVFQLEILGQSLGFFAGERAFIVGQLMFFRLRQLLG